MTVHVPRASAGSTGRGRSHGPGVTWIPRTKRTLLQRVLRVGIDRRRVAHPQRAPAPLIAAADVVHVHSNGLLAEVGARLAHQQRQAGRADALRHRDLALPAQAVRTGSLHARVSRAPTPSPSTASGLLERARRARPRAPAAATSSIRRWRRRSSSTTQRAQQARAGRARPDRGAPAGQREAPASARRAALPARGAWRGRARHIPDTQLVICGTGALLPELQAVARSRGRGASRHVRRPRRQRRSSRATAPPRISSCCRRCSKRCPPSRSRRSRAGTPVISSDNPGGVELHGVFGDDVQVVPKEQPAALAAAIVAALRREAAHDARPRSAIVEQRFRAEAVARQYWDVYAE